MQSIDITKYVPFLNHVSTKEKLIFIRNLSVMIKSGITLSQVLNTLSRQTENKAFKKILTDIAINVDKGNQFSEELKKYPGVFDELSVNMVKAGEVSGKLDENLNQIYIQIKKQHTLLTKIRNALIYPSVVLVAMVIIVVLMMIVVVPKITQIFEEANATLPMATVILIESSRMIREHGILMAIGLIIFLIAFIKFKKTKIGKKILHYFYIKTPILSGILRKIYLARFARTLSSLLRTDIQIIKSFDITAKVIGNYYYEKAILEIKKSLKKGQSINQVISNYPKLFPPMVQEMVSAGEQSGSLDKMLDDIANFYEEEVSNIMETLPTIIEPILIVILGIAVGWLAVAIIMPMYSLTQQF